MSLSLAALLIRSVSLFVEVLTWLIIIRALLSWFRPRGYNRFLFEAQRLLYALTEPILAPIRNVLPGAGMGIDFSPLIAIILLNLVENLLRSLIYRVF